MPGGDAGLFIASSNNTNTNIDNVDTGGSNGVSVLLANPPIWSVPLSSMGTLNITNTSFTNNGLDVAAPALWTYGMWSVSLQTSAWLNNTGGAAALNEGLEGVNITNCSFVDNGM